MFRANKDCANLSFFTLFFGWCFKSVTTVVQTLLGYLQISECSSRKNDIIFLILKYNFYDIP